MNTRRVALATLATLSLLAMAGACREERGSTRELCAAIADADFTDTLAGFDPTDPEIALDQLRTARVELGDLLDAAPEEVHDDLQVEIDYVQDLIDALDGVTPGDAAEASQQVQAVTAAHPDVDAAAAELTAFADEEC